MSQGDPPTYLWQAVVCILLFFPGAFVALWFSSQVTSLTKSGDLRGAWRASRLARTSCLLCVLTAVAILVTLAGALGG